MNTTYRHSANIIAQILIIVNTITSRKPLTKWAKFDIIVNMKIGYNAY